MEKEADLNRRKFMEIGIYTITGAIAAVSSVALTRFAVGTSFKKKRSKWIELDSDDLQDADEGFSRGMRDEIEQCAMSRLADGRPFHKPPEGFTAGSPCGCQLDEATEVVDSFRHVFFAACFGNCTRYLRAKV